MKGEAPFELAKVQDGLKVGYARRVRKFNSRHEPVTQRNFIQGNESYWV